VEGAEGKLVHKYALYIGETGRERRERRDEDGSHLRVL
jgi:hypothetical protein